MSGGGSAGHEVMQGYGIDNDGAAAPTGANGQPEALPGPPPKLSLADLERMQKEQKKKAKKAEKAAKKVHRVDSSATCISLLQECLSSSAVNDRPYEGCVEHHSAV